MSSVNMLNAAGGVLGGSHDRTCSPLKKGRKGVSGRASILLISTFWRHPFAAALDAHPCHTGSALYLRIIETKSKMNGTCNLLRRALVLNLVWEDIETTQKKTSSPMPGLCSFLRGANEGLAYGAEVR